MKKLFTLNALLFLFIAVLWSSCGTSTSITKRRYTKGYYISHNHSRYTPKAKTEKQNVVTAKPMLVAPKMEKAAEMNEPENTPSEVLTANAPLSKAEAAMVNETKKGGSKKIGTLPGIQRNLNAAELLVKKPFKAINNVVVNASDDDDGLSLFWIVIVVLLVLFFLGLAGDILGDLIYILLVIALVLLILWLLKVL